MCSFDLVTGRSRALAAGITWTSRTASAQWAARGSHTSVVDAAGAIYVIGGSVFDGTGFAQDVWASTNGGADRTKSGVVGVTGWVPRGTTRGTTRVLAGYQRVRRCTQAYQRGTRGVPKGLLGGL